MSDEGRYLTTPIYYATGEPHIGHAYSTFLADALARYYRQSGARVFFLTGTDEFGQKIQEEAARRAVEPQVLCDRMASRFESAWREMDIRYDRFIRTTETGHQRVVQAFLDRLNRRGYIYDDIYSGWYCVHEERYWTEKDLGAGGTCPDCGRPVRRIEEKNYFFRMSRLQDALIRHVEERPKWIVPEIRRNEVLGFLGKPLADLSISRPRSRLHWGVPLPFDEEHVTYVWVDALMNYVTASGAIDPGRGRGKEGFEDVSGSWWPADLHIVGKDILTPHAVYWPTLLMAAGLPLPRQLLVHGWWLSAGAKMSKSLGNVVDPLDLRTEFGTDAVRWYLLREMPTGADASYTPERFLARYGELANVLGNLASRTTSMVERYTEGAVPEMAGAGLGGRDRSDARLLPRGDGGAQAPRGAQGRDGARPGREPLYRGQRAVVAREGPRPPGGTRGGSRVARARPRRSRVPHGTRDAPEDDGAGPGPRPRLGPLSFRGSSGCADRRQGRESSPALPEGGASRTAGRDGHIGRSSPPAPLARSRPQLDTSVRIHVPLVYGGVRVAKAAAYETGV